MLQRKVRDDEGVIGQVAEATAPESRRAILLKFCIHSF
jgi:hypothetical protein